MIIKGNSVGYPLPDPRKGLEMQGGINMNGQKLNGLNAPMADDEAANMGYVKRAYPHNLLDNSDFTNPVNQRGVTSKTGAVWTHIVDRWYINLQEGVTATLTESGLSVSGDCFIQQRYEKGYLRADTVYTSAVYYSDGSVDLSSKLDFDQTGFDCLTLNIEANKTVAYIALYEGEYTAETLPEYQPKGYGVELAECMRYFQKNSIMFVASNPWDTVYSIYHFTPAMRIRPTVKSFGRSTGTPDVYDYWDASTNSHKSITGVGVNVATGYVKFTNSNGLFEVGMQYEATFEASADL